MRFSPHLSVISMQRSEPTNLDFETQTKKLTKKFSDLAEKIVLTSYLKAEDLTDRKQQAEEKIKGMIEFDERLKSVKKFLEQWNSFRHFYFGLDELVPKNKNQLTMIENAIAYANKNDLKIPMLVACVHKAFVKRKFMPGFQEILFRGVEHYERYYDGVMADIGKASYEENARNRV